MVRDFIASGDSRWVENRVEIDHPSLSEVLGVLFDIPLPAQLKYQSWYLHLAGPWQVLVSMGILPPLPTQEVLPRREQARGFTNYCPEPR